MFINSTDGVYGFTFIDCTSAEILKQRERKGREKDES